MAAPVTRGAIAGGMLGSDSSREGVAIETQKTNNGIKKK